MTGRGTAARLLCRALRPATSIASPLLPEATHPGKRARRAIAALRCSPVDHGFERALLEAAWRARLLKHHVARLRPAELQTFCDRSVEYAGAMTRAQVLSQTRPIIFATPH